MNAACHGFSPNGALAERIEPHPFRVAGRELFAVLPPLTLIAAARIGRRALLMNVAAALLVALIVGVCAEVPATRGAIAALEEFMLHVPGIRHLYGTLKDFSDAFLSDNKRFDKPVLVRLSKTLDARVLGFITSEDLSQFGLLEEVAVYVPQSYNFGGNLLILPRSSVTAVEADSTSVMAFIVSGGVTKLAEAEASQRGLRGYSRRLGRAQRLRQAR